MSKVQHRKGTIAGNRSNGNIVCEYLEKYPHLPTRTIARLLVKEVPTAFSCIESCRKMLCKYRGNDSHAARFAQGKYHRPNGHQSDGVIPIPPPLTEIDPWRIVPLEFQRGLLLYDVHIPYHDEAACRVALDYGRMFNPDCIILAGDLLDFHSISSWDRDPRQRDTAVELSTAERFIEVLRDTFPKARLVLLEGNHEQRWWRFAWRNIPEFAGIPEFSLAEMLHAADYGLEVICGMKPIKAGPHLHILHGHEFGGFMTNPVNPARGLFLRAKVNSICGHFHQTSSHTEPGLGHPVSTFSSGALCNLHPNYRPINKWNHGFITVELHRAQWSVSNHKIIGGQVV
jgi:predicted phosphodiesterase